MTIEITRRSQPRRLGTRRREHELEREELRAKAADGMRDALETRHSLAQLRHGDREVELVHDVAGVLDRLDERAPGEEVSVGAVQDAALGVAKAAEQQLQADRPVRDRKSVV